MKGRIKNAANRGGKEIVSRVMPRSRAGDQIPLKHGAGRVSRECVTTLANTIAKKAVTRSRGDVVRIDETDRRLAEKRSYIAILKMSVVIEGDIVKTGDREEAIRDAGEQVVCD